METNEKEMTSQKAEERVRAPRSLGIIYSEESSLGLTHPYFINILNAFKDEADAHGYDITFVNHHMIGPEMSYPEYCRRRGLEGVCLVCADFDSEEIGALVRSEVPCLSVDHIFRHVPAVLSDNETGVHKLVAYAIRMGHRRIAFVHGHNNSIVTRTRIKQFRNVLEYNGLPVRQEYVREGRYIDIGLTHRIVGELLRLPEPPTCILLSDDVSYLGAQDAAHELGLRIPDDISFMGYDGIPMLQALKPKLTTIRQNADRIGRTAARGLIDMIENPGTAKRVPVIFPVELLEGGTVRKL